MKYLIFASLLFLNSCNYKVKTNTDFSKSKELSFYTSDSIKIFADLYEVNKESPTILLFHQGASNSRAEYERIIPRLVKSGYNVLAIDQRMGGQRYGKYNRTVSEFSKNNYTYCDAYADLDAALTYIIDQGFIGNKLLWGSSYSASLAIQLASKRSNDVAAVLAFSPSSGGPMKSCKPDDYFKSLKAPLLLLRPKREMEIESVQKQFDLAKANGHETYIAEHGTHGSSMLVEERVAENVEANWNVVLNFIQKI